LWTDGRTDGRTGGRTFFPSILLGRLSEVNLKTGRDEQVNKESK